MRTCIWCQIAEYGERRELPPMTLVRRAERLWNWLLLGRHWRKHMALPRTVVTP